MKKNLSKRKIQKAENSKTGKQSELEYNRKPFF